MLPICGDCYHINTINTIKLRDGISICQQCESSNLILIDGGLVDIVIKFWMLGINTLFCCEGHQDMILFGSYISIAHNKKSELIQFRDEFVLPIISIYPDLVSEPVKLISKKIRYDIKTEFKYRFHIHTAKNNYISVYDGVRTSTNFKLFLYDLIIRVVENYNKFPFIKNPKPQCVTKYHLPIEAIKHCNKCKWF